MFLENGIFRSELLLDLPVVHGFTTRQWGNLGFGKKPKDPEVIANRHKLFRALQVTDRIHVQPRQLHSSHCIEASQFQPGIEADSIFTRSSDHLLSILTADCVPILVYHPEGVCAAVHAGWRGLYNGIIPQTISRIPFGCSAAIGPAIGPCCYEVSEELATNFEQKFGTEVIAAAAHRKPHLDLVRAAVVQLMQTGIEDLDVLHLCTSCHPDLFFSYRRDGSSGRLMSFIGLL